MEACDAGMYDNIEEKLDSYAGQDKSHESLETDVSE